MSHAQQARKRAQEHADGTEEPEPTTCEGCGESFGYSIHEHTEHDGIGFDVWPPTHCDDCEAEPAEADALASQVSRVLRAKVLAMRALTFFARALFWIVMGLAGFVVAVCTFGASRAKRKR